MNEQEIKPCPFCGSTSVGLSGEYMTFVICDDCGAEGPVFRKGFQEAIHKWNGAKR